jgi:thiamine transport system ATP-binding protein
MTMSSPPPPLLRLMAYGCSYHGVAYRFDLTLKSCERVAVMGPSGAGKSTLLGLIAGLLPAEFGQIFWQGQDIGHCGLGERPINLLFQADNIFPHLSVMENCLLALTRGLRANAAQRLLAQTLLEELGLHERISALSANLSGGEEQRLALARMFLTSHPLWLLDEPFAALDPARREELLHLTEHLARQSRRSVVMVTHDLQDAWSFAERLLLLEAGKIILDIPMQEITHYREHPSLKALCGKRPLAWQAR